LHIFLIVTASFVILARHSVSPILCTFTWYQGPRFAVRCRCLSASSTSRDLIFSLMLRADRSSDVMFLWTRSGIAG
jgi:hypothetical protein